MIRQAHPGPDAKPYNLFDQKFRDAQTYKRVDGVLAEVLVDDVQGSVHQVYGTMADPTYLVDRDGRVSYYNMWTYAPIMNEAIKALLAQDGKGVVLGEGMDQIPYIAPWLVDGWRGIRRGLPQSYVDMELASPGFGTAMFLGHKLRPILAPVTLRSELLPPVAKVGLAVGALGIAALVAVAIQKRNKSKSL